MSFVSNSVVNLSEKRDKGYHKTWLEPHVRAVVRQCHDLISQSSSGKRHEIVMRRLFDCIGGSNNDGLLETAIKLPIVVCKVVRGKVVQTDYVLTSALATMEAGIYILDHVLDNELDEELQDLKPGGTLLGAILLGLILPRQILAGMPRDAHPFKLIKMLCDSQARIAAGQLEDVSTSLARPIERAKIIETVKRKSGERRAFYARVAALSAGAPIEKVSAYSCLGSCIGIARQLRSDLFDLFRKGESRDLAAGVQTLPIACFFEKASEAERIEMQRRLNLSPLANRHREVVDLLQNSDAVRTVVGIVQAHCQKAIELVPLLADNEDDRALLNSIVDDAAIFPFWEGESSLD